MTEHNDEIPAKIVLPDFIIGTRDINRLLNELEKLDDFFHQSKLRSPGTSVQLPKTTNSLERLADLNGLSLLEPENRKKMTLYLTEIKNNSPKFHISFAVEPAPQFSAKIVAWIRKNIHPTATVDIGLQPNISIGCIVRTTNKVFDMSLRQRFKNSKQILHKEIGAGK